LFIILNLISFCISVKPLSVVVSFCISVCLLQNVYNIATLLLHAYVKRLENWFEWSRNVWHWDVPDYCNARGNACGT